MPSLMWKISSKQREGMNPECLWRRLKGCGASYVPAHFHLVGIICSQTRTHLKTHSGEKSNKCWLKGCGASSVPLSRFLLPANLIRTRSVLFTFVFLSQTRTIYDIYHIWFGEPWLCLSLNLKSPANGESRGIIGMKVKAKVNEK